MKPLTLIIPLYAVMAGVVAGMLFAFVHYRVIYGITAPLLPLSCLAFAGLTYGRAGLNAALAVCVPLVFVSLPLSVSTMLLFLHIIPVNLLIRLLMMARLAPSIPYLFWSPPIYAVSYVCMYLALFVAMLVGSDSTFYMSIVDSIRYFVPDEDGMFLSGSGQGDSLTEHPKEAGLYAITVISMVLVVASVFITHQLLRYVGMARRPQLRFAALDYPPLMTLALTGCFTVMLFATVNTVFFGSAVSGLLVMLCAYFYMGLSTIHAMLHEAMAGKKSYGVLLIFCVFYMVMVSFAPVSLLCVSLFAVVRHIIALWHIKHQRID
jgi:hypothetical protein